MQDHPAEGTVAVNADGSLTYSPSLDFDGADAFTYLAIDPRGVNAPATVTITGPRFRPLNDDRQDADVISGASGSVTGTNVGATSSDGEFHSYSIWFRWTAPVDGVFAFDTCGSDFESDLGVLAPGSPDEMDEQNVTPSSAPIRSPSAPARESASSSERSPAPSTMSPSADSGRTPRATWCCPGSNGPRPPTTISLTPR